MLCFGQPRYRICSNVRPYYNCYLSCSNSWPAPHSSDCVGPKTLVLLIHKSSNCNPDPIQGSLLRAGLALPPLTRSRPEPLHRQPCHSLRFRLFLVRLELLPRCFSPTRVAPSSATINRMSSNTSGQKGRGSKFRTRSSGGLPCNHRSIYIYKYKYIYICT